MENTYSTDSGRAKAAKEKFNNNMKKKFMKGTESYFMKCKLCNKNIQRAVKAKDSDPNQDDRFHNTRLKDNDFLNCEKAEEIEKSDNIKEYCRSVPKEVCGVELTLDPSDMDECDDSLRTCLSLPQEKGLGQTCEYENDTLVLTEAQETVPGIVYGDGNNEFHNDLSEQSSTTSNVTDISFNITDHNKDAIETTSLNDIETEIEEVTRNKVVCQVKTANEKIFMDSICSGYKETVGASPQNSGRQNAGGSKDNSPEKTGEHSHDYSRTTNTSGRTGGSSMPMGGAGGGEGDGNEEGERYRREDKTPGDYQEQAEKDGEKRDDDRQLSNDIRREGGTDVPEECSSSCGLNQHLNEERTDVAVLNSRAVTDAEVSTERSSSRVTDQHVQSGRAESETDVSTERSSFHDMDHLNQVQEVIDGQFYEERSYFHGLDPHLNERDTFGTGAVSTGGEEEEVAVPNIQQEGRDNNDISLHDERDNDWIVRFCRPNENTNSSHMSIENSLRPHNAQAEMSIAHTVDLSARQPAAPDGASGTFSHTPTPKKPPDLFSLRLKLKVVRGTPSTAPERLSTSNRRPLVEGTPSTAPESLLTSNRRHLVEGTQSTAPESLLTSNRRHLVEGTQSTAPESLLTSNRRHLVEGTQSTAPESLLTSNRRHLVEGTQSTAPESLLTSNRRPFVERTPSIVRQGTLASGRGHVAEGVMRSAAARSLTSESQPSLPRSADCDRQSPEVEDGDEPPPVFRVRSHSSPW